MIFEIIPPPEKYSSLVESIFYFKDYNAEHPFERLVPDGSMNIIIELDNQLRHIVDNDTHEPIYDYKRVWVSGLHDEYFTITVPPDGELLVIRFKPCGAKPFLHQPIDELKGKVLNANEKLWMDLLQLRENILAASNLKSKLNLAIEWLHSKFDEDHLPPEAILTAAHQIQQQPAYLFNQLDKMADEAGYSNKQFIQIFKNFTGVPPKIFQRIMRFNEAIALIREEKTVNWVQISSDSGYYDQAHFIKEFQSFSGFNPTDFLELESDRINFFPLD